MLIIFNVHLAGQSKLFIYSYKTVFYRIDLDENAREVRGSLYCLPCHNKLDLPVCAACRRLIDDRVISALGKQWHVEV